MQAAPTLSIAPDDSLMLLVPEDNVQNVGLAGDRSQAWLTLSKRTSLSSLKSRM